MTPSGLTGPLEVRPAPLRVAIKPWIGYSPLAVARDAKLCELKFVPVNELDDAILKMKNRQIDVMMCPPEALVCARANRCGVSAVLLADISYSADFIVAEEGIEVFSDLKGKTVGVDRLDAPHFLILALKENYPDVNIELRTGTLDQVVKWYNTKEIQGAGLYEPYLSKLTRSYKIIEKSGVRGVDAKVDDKSPRIVDVIAVRDDLLSATQGKERIEQFINAWYDAIGLLKSKKPNAIKSACNFYGEFRKGKPLTEEQYADAVAGIDYGDETLNRDLFFASAGQVSNLNKRMAAAEQRLRRGTHLDGPFDFAGDESSVNLSVIKKRLP